MIRIFIVTVTLTLFASCTTVTCIGVCPPPNRIGSTCADGTKSEQIGKSACSHHGGVACWHCEQKKEKKKK